MEIFYADDIAAGRILLNLEESSHCARVLRHREGDSICVVDGRGTMYRCTIDSTGETGPAEEGRGKSSRKNLQPLVSARIDSAEPGWHSHPYRLTMAVCPTKNPDRYEWMVEKICEIGVDCIVPVIGERSERRVLKTERLGRLVLSAAKQSLKAAFPVVAEPCSVLDFIRSFESEDSGRCLKYIAYCSDEVQPRAGLAELLREHFMAASSLEGSDSRIPKNGGSGAGSGMPLDGGSGAGSPAPGSDAAADSKPEIAVLIGPEGDFSPAEVRAALAAGFIPVHLGSSRLRTETAAVVAATAVYLTATPMRKTP